MSKKENTSVQYFSPVNGYICYGFVVCILQAKNNDEKTKWIATLLCLIQKDLNYMLVRIRPVLCCHVCTMYCNCISVSLQVLWLYVCTYICTYACIYIILMSCVIILYLGLAITVYFVCVSFTQPTHVIVLFWYQNLIWFRF